MNRKVTTVLVNAAMAGLLAGFGGVAPARAATGQDRIVSNGCSGKSGCSSSTSKADQAKTSDRHVCRGKNSCKGKGGCQVPVAQQPTA